MCREGVECERFWSTWACPRQVRGWPRREAPPRVRGVEAQAAPAKRTRPLPRTSWEGGLGRRVSQAAARLLHPPGVLPGRPRQRRPASPPALQPSPSTWPLSRLYAGCQAVDLPLLPPVRRGHQPGRQGLRHPGLCSGERWPAVRDVRGDSTLPTGGPAPLLLPERRLHGSPPHLRRLPSRAPRGSPVRAEPYPGACPGGAPRTSLRRTVRATDIRLSADRGSHRPTMLPLVRKSGLMAA